VTLREEAALIANQADFHLFHEQLEPWNDPVYFSEFMRRAGLHGLIYLADARPSIETKGTASFREALGGTLDRVRLEQYLDFVRGRPFRQTLLCHANLNPSPEPLATALRSLSIRGRAEPAEPSPEDAARGPGVVSFKALDGGMVTTNNPIVAGAMQTLLEAAPGAFRFDELQRRIAERLAATPPEEGDDGMTLAAALLSCMRAGVVEFRALPWTWPTTPSELPKASALARWQALHFEVVTSLAHSRHRLSGMERFLLEHLDGTNDRSQLVRIIEAGFKSGDLKLEGFVPTRENLAAVLDDVLMHLARSALLVA
jgi:methyltransferase-like protein